MTSWIDADKQLIWHPFTQHTTAADPLVITRAQGAYLYDDQGHKVFDAISSWWVNTHGHAHPQIAAAIYQQACTLEHVMFAGITHQPAIELCQQLAPLLPSSLCRFFFSDNGSTAVEVALKMAHQYWRNLGTERHLFLAFDGAYHGDTVGAMSVGRGSGFHSAFEPLLFAVERVPFVATHHDDVYVEQREQQALQQLDQVLAQHASSIAAMIIEPIVQGASGMRFCRVEFLEQVMQRLRAHNILIIFDEVMTGFGRLGRHFACHFFNTAPDIICLSKGLTGGFLPLSLTVCHHTIFAAFGGQSFNSAFAHGHSFTANPLGCAAAIASLKLLQHEHIQQQWQMIAKTHRDGLEQLQSSIPQCRHARTFGTIAAIDHPALLHDESLLRAFRQEALRQGELLRPLGGSIYWLPPYCASADDLMQSYEKIPLILRKIGLL